MKKCLACFVFIFSFVLSAPERLRAGEEFNFISTEELAKGIQDKSLVVVDCNRPETYQNGHIPTALYMNSSVPDAKVLPKDKNANLVFYCKNPKCMASHEGAKFALSQGYTKVRVYPLGIDGWEQAGMRVETK
jgi:Rhodanese-related sulfurtransferase